MSSVSGLDTLWLGITWVARFGLAMCRVREVFSRENGGAGVRLSATFPCHETGGGEEVHTVPM